MSRITRVLRDALSTLAELGAPCALVGGLATSARAEPRFTRDVDLAVAVGSDREAEALLRELIGRGYRVLAQVEQEETGRLATVRTLPPSEQEGGVVVDLLFASSGIEPEIASGATSIDILDALVVPVARAGDLIALKVLARDDVRRPQDLMDLRALLRESGDEEIQHARQAAALITARGYSRGRDLVVQLEALLSDTQTEEA